MLNEVLQSIKGIAVYPIIGLFIFVAAFVYVIVHTWRMKRSDIEYASRLPLDSKNFESSSGSLLPGENQQGENK